MNGFRQDLRYALRGLQKSRGFTAVAALTLAIGIGAATAVFSVVNGVLLKPLPYPEAQALVAISHLAPGANFDGDINTSAAQFFTYRETNRSFKDIGLWSIELGTVTGLAEPEEIRRLSVTHGTLQALGIHPAVGRWFSQEDDADDSPPTAILTYEYWRRRFGGDPSVIGRTITVDSRPRQIIGVMSNGFRFLDVQRPDVILPMRFDRSGLRLGSFNYRGLARLKPGVTLLQANTDVARMNEIWLKAWPEPGPGFAKMIENTRLTPALRPLKQEVVGDVGGILWMLMGSIGIVLVIACANVANLLLVRVEGRQHEVAVRTALGASWTRIARELLVESLMLGLMAAALGIGLAFDALRLLIAISPTMLPRLNEITMDASVLAFAIITSVVSSVVRLTV